MLPWKSHIIILNKNILSGYYFKKACIFRVQMPHNIFDPIQHDPLHSFPFHSIILQNRNYSGFTPLSSVDLHVNHLKYARMDVCQKGKSILLHHSIVSIKFPLWYTIMRFQRGLHVSYPLPLSFQIGPIVCQSALVGKVSQYYTSYPRCPHLFALM